MEVQTTNIPLGLDPKQSPILTQQRNLDAESPKILHEISAESVSAATKLQKVYRSYRTRRRLADSAVIAEVLWWQVLEFARLNHSTISFFELPESIVSRWNRVSLNASKIGQGLAVDAKALLLAFKHWIEAIDPRHRYGHNLHLYYLKWCGSNAAEPFFYWLDVGDGRNVDLHECPRSLLRRQCIKYLGPKERERYEYEPVDGKIVQKQTGEPLHATDESEGGMWIFVMSTSKKLYAGQKKKGMFHHSSFLAGGTTLAAGGLTAEKGVLKSVGGHSGHYKPSEKDLNRFLTILGENGVDLKEVQVHSSCNEDDYGDPKRDQSAELPIIESRTMVNANENEAKDTFKRTLSGGLQIPRTNVPRNEILRRIKSKREACSYQLGKQLSLKWCSGAGPRIGCVADYPVELRTQAMEISNLSPRLNCQSTFV